MRALTHRSRDARSEDEIAAHESRCCRAHRLASEAHRTTLYDRPEENRKRGVDRARSAQQQVRRRFGHVTYRPSPPELVKPNFAVMPIPSPSARFRGIAGPPGETKRHRTPFLAQQQAQYA